MQLISEELEMNRKNNCIRKAATKSRTVLAILDGLAPKPARRRKSRPMKTTKRGLYMFRPHRGGLLESVSERRTFTSKSQIVSHVMETFDVKMRRSVNLEGRVKGGPISEGRDPRIGWAWTGFVTVDGRCVGMWTDEWDKEVLLSYLDEHGIR